MFFSRFDDCRAHVGYWGRMDVERIIDDIEQLQEMFEAPDIRPLSVSDLAAANRRHDEQQASSPWFRLWQRYGVCCRLRLRYFNCRRTFRASPSGPSIDSFQSEAASVL